MLDSVHSSEGDAGPSSPVKGRKAAASVYSEWARYRCLACGHRAKQKPSKVRSKAPPSCRKCGSFKWYEVMLNICTLDCYPYPHQAGYSKCRSRRDGKVEMETTPGVEGDYPF